MDFSLSEETCILRDTIRSFAEKRIRPISLECDEKQELDMDVIEEMAEMGLLGIIISSEWGGADIGYVDYAVIIEELARVDPAYALVIAAHNSLPCNHISMFGTDEQKRKFLIPMAEGQHLGSWGLTEPCSGSDASALLTFAEDKGDHYLVNGTKSFITSGLHAKTFVSLVKTDKAAPGVSGISALIIENDTPGYSVTKKENKLGVRASDTVQITLEDAIIPKENLIGNAGEGFYQAMKILDGGRVSIAALGVGLAQGAYEHSLAYSKQRESFGKPIGRHQGIAFKLAEMATEVEAARLLTLRAASIKDEGKYCVTESAMAKYYAGEAAVRISSEAVQIFGGYGFVKDYPVEKLFRDSRLCTIGEGTSEIMKTVIAKQIMK